MSADEQREKAVELGLVRIYLKLATPGQKSFATAFPAVSDQTIATILEQKGSFADILEENMESDPEILNREMNGQPVYEAFNRANPDAYNEIDWLNKTWAKIFEMTRSESSHADRVALLENAIRATVEVKERLFKYGNAALPKSWLVNFSNIEPPREQGRMDAAWKSLNPDAPISRLTFFGFTVHRALELQIEDLVDNLTNSLMRNIPLTQDLKRLDYTHISNLLPWWDLSGARRWYESTVPQGEVEALRKKAKSAWFEPSDLKKRRKVRPDQLDAEFQGYDFGLMRHSFMPASTAYAGPADEVIDRLYVNRVDPEMLLSEMLLYRFVREQVHNLIKTRTIDAFHYVDLLDQLDGQSSLVRLH
ncbi:MAG: hypothetical protein KDA77_23390, partial [Planctomycetaceae bacterium]|nr:hypothetical protein [Planctomycetaceae bacterium]